jgi:endonuclease YncB( thermonuclease family)
LHQVIIPVVGLAVVFGTAAQAAERPACTPAVMGSAQVQAVIDGRTVQTTEGTEVRLAGIETPPDKGRAALEALVAGRVVTLSRLGEDLDRYGRRVALITVDGRPPEQSVQNALLQQGSARVSAQIGDFACAAGLLAAEQRARTAGLAFGPTRIM